MARVGVPLLLLCVLCVTFVAGQDAPSTAVQVSLQATQATQAIQATQHHNQHTPHLH